MRNAPCSRGAFLILVKEKSDLDLCWYGEMCKIRGEVNGVKVVILRIMSVVTCLRDARRVRQKQQSE
jgi:hypothetical protein